LWDVPFIALYVGILVLAVLFVSGNLGRSKLGGFRLNALRRAGPALVGATVAAGILDLVENAALALGLHRGATELAENEFWAIVAATAGWAKFVLLFIVGAYVLMGLFGWIAMPPRQLRNSVTGPVLPAERAAESEGGGLGICLSGGGVRAATYSLGVLQELDAEGLYDEARWLSAVSGGSYMAGAWAIARQTPSDSSAQPEPRPWAKDSPEIGHMRRHLNYLFAREGGTGGALATVLVGLAINLLTFFTMLWLLSRPLGWLIGSRLIAGDNGSGQAFSFAFDDRRHWMPVAIWGGLSGAVFLIWVLQRRLASYRHFLLGQTARHVSFLVALGSMCIVGLLGFVLLVAPAAASAVPMWSSSSSRSEPA
jgi:hypothetical protein